MKKMYKVIAVCLLILGISAIFVTNASIEVYAYSGGSTGYNEEYDILYEDIVNTYEQGLITMGEAEEEIMELSRSAIITGTEDIMTMDGTEDEIMELSNTGTQDNE